MRLVSVVWSSIMLSAFPARAQKASGERPNIVFVMADDLDFDYKQDRLAIMPNLKKHWADAGVQFVNHVAAQPVCGPSRSSLLAGRYPHNTGYKANGDKDSVEHFSAIQNNTFGTWLSAAGYHTAFMGKSVNGMETHVFAGWSRWGGFVSGPKTYNYYNATEFEARFTGPRNQQPGGPVKQTNHLGVHQADFLPIQVEKEVEIALQDGKPFALHVTPTMVHWGSCYGPCADGTKDCLNSTDPAFEWNIPKWNNTPGHISFPCDPCPSLRTEHLFEHLPVPHLPSWNSSAEGGMSAWMDQKPYLSPQQAYRQDMCYRNRSSSAVDLDDMLGSIVRILEGKGVMNNTILIFTSDNGFHLGEHKLPFGKTEPYTTDTALPLYVSGPGVAQGQVRHHPTNHMDITRTLVDIAGAVDHVTGPPLDGKSFLPALGPSPVPANTWRTFSFSEFFQFNNTWAAMHFLDEDVAKAAEEHEAARVAKGKSAPPPSRARTIGYSLHRWCTNDTEVYHMADGDPWQLRNIGGENTTPFGAQVKDRNMGKLAALSKCSGQECSDPAPQVAVSPLQCYQIHKGSEGLDPYDRIGYNH